MNRKRHPTNYVWGFIFWDGKKDAPKALDHLWMRAWHRSEEKLYDRSVKHIGSPSVERGSAQK